MVSTRQNMGLDWLPGPKPQKGFEDEFLKLWRRFQGEDDKSELLAELKKRPGLTVSPYETLRAPRVGFDSRANEWARQAFPMRADKSLSEEAFMQHLNGSYVLDLVPP